MSTYFNPNLMNPGTGQPTNQRRWMYQGQQQQPPMANPNSEEEEYLAGSCGQMAPPMWPNQNFGPNQIYFPNQAQPMWQNPNWAPVQNFAPFEPFTEETQKNSGLSSSLCIVIIIIIILLIVAFTRKSNPVPTV